MIKMPNYILSLNNKTYELGFFVCDMEADEYAINKFNLDINNKYSIIEKADHPGCTTTQTGIEII